MRSVRNLAFSKANERRKGDAPTERGRDFIIWCLSAAFGVVSTLGGVWLADRLSNTSDLKRAEREALVATLAANDYGNKPDSVVMLNLAMNSIRYVTYSDAGILEERAEMLRRNGFCENVLTEECKRSWVESVAVYRRQLGLKPVSNEDLRLLLDHPLKQVEAAINMGRKFGVEVGSPAPRH